jgi:hypothetical protein
VRCVDISNIDLAIGSSTQPRWNFSLSQSESRSARNSRNFMENFFFYQFRLRLHSEADMIDLAGKKMSDKKTSGGMNNKNTFDAKVKGKLLL